MIVWMLSAYQYVTQLITITSYKRLPGLMYRGLQQSRCGNCSAQQQKPLDAAAAAQPTGSTTASLLQAHNHASNDRNPSPYRLNYLVLHLPPSPLLWSLLIDDETSKPPGYSKHETLQLDFEQCQENTQTSSYNEPPRPILPGVA